MILRNNSLKDFLKSNNKKIVCFGASQMFLDMCMLYEEYGIVNRVHYLVDNDIKKQGSYISFKERNFDIYSPNIFNVNKDDDYVIIITAGYFYDIIRQLDEMESLNETECYIYPLMHYTKREPEYIQLPDGDDLIPKVIHYCWFGGNKIPEFEKSCIQSWRKICPDFEIQEWNESNYDVSKIAYTGEAYEAGKYAFVSDYARLDVLYRHGGVYFDTDVELIKPINPLLKLKSFASFQHNPRINTGLGIGAIKGLNIIKDMRDYYHNINFINDDGSLNTTPCTIYQRNVLLKYGLIENGKVQKVGDIQILPQDYFQPRCPITGITKITPVTFAIHHSRESWASDINAQKRRSTLKMVESIIKRISGS